MAWACRVTGMCGSLAAFRACFFLPVSDSESWRVQQAVCVRVCVCVCVCVVCACVCTRALCGGGKGSLGAGVGCLRGRAEEGHPQI